MISWLYCSSPCELQLCATLTLQLIQLLALAIRVLNCILNLAPLNQPGADGESDAFLSRCVNLTVCWYWITRAAVSLWIIESHLAVSPSDPHGLTHTHSTWRTQPPRLDALAVHWVWPLLNQEASIVACTSTNKRQATW